MSLILKKKFFFGFTFIFIMFEVESKTQKKFVNKLEIFIQQKLNK